MIENINICEMKTEHLDGIMIVENLSFKIPWSRNSFIEELSNEMAIYLVALNNGKVIGYGGLWKIFDEGHITNIAVHPEFRRCKVASKLIEKMLVICEEMGINSLTLEVRKSNHAAQELYKKYGFKSEGMRKNYYTDTGEDALIMWRHNS